MGVFFLNEKNYRYDIITGTRPLTFFVIFTVERRTSRRTSSKRNFEFFYTVTVQLQITGINLLNTGTGPNCLRPFYGSASVQHRAFS